jgi:hypothetical protein
MGSNDGLVGAPIGEECHPKDRTVSTSIKWKDDIEVPHDEPLDESDEPLDEPNELLDVPNEPLPHEDPGNPLD